jgi:hypothetical protein
VDVSFPTDADGFLSQECPSCGQQFKVLFGEGSEDPISYCLYCGHEGRDCWHTTAQVEYMESVAANVVLGPELKKLERELKRSSKGFIKIDMKSELPAVGLPPMEVDGDFDIVRFPCCNETVKAVRHGKLFCIICGTEIDMTTSNAKKIFLSHKGVDKALVIDFKDTLAQLGFDPWIDDDAMPAGTTLERGILQGMQDSCGVVFFITTSFKDGLAGWHYRGRHGTEDEVDLNRAFGRSKSNPKRSRRRQWQNLAFTIYGRRGHHDKRQIAHSEQRFPNGRTLGGRPRGLAASSICQGPGP